MEDDRDEVNGITMIHEVMKLAVRMKLRTNGKEKVESVYYARNIKSALKGIHCGGIIGHYKATFITYK